MEVNQQELANRLSMTDRNVRLLVDRGVLISSPNGGYDMVANRERYRIFHEHNLQVSPTASKQPLKTLTAYSRNWRPSQTLKSAEKFWENKARPLASLFPGWISQSRCSLSQSVRCLNRSPTGLRTTPFAMSCVCASCSYPTMRSSRGS